ncbi:DUF58 domain-containing protein [Brevibacterium sp. JSBI002]|uniref:DUF58 domain-containing protein n=1 Tax=Brevibacterium sp. JSBI002 TaxID=2886045 RepID=UPI002231D59C|nr:DUF58 domain-containing protein [Brevibacterium sp. JSBI002]UZD61035.1 DUF58 domain-containing protein [Brevibacterium sp. JSBI002]WGP04756.1 DUF58 domain-containing protein [Bacillus subtilis]
MRLSTSGIIFVLAGAALIITAYRFALPGLLPAGLLLLGLVLLSALLILWGTRRVSIAMSTNLHEVALSPSGDRYPLAAEGKEVEVQARVTNIGQLAIPAATIDFTPAEGFGDSTSGDVPALAHGASQTVLTSFTPNRRGVSGIDSVLITVFGPFGLVKMKKKVHGAFPVAVSVPILPARIPQDSSIRPARLDDGKVRTGHTTRDFHTREYVPGDDLRHVHWPSTAKSGELMVRHEADEETLHSLILIDLVADEGAEEPSDLEIEFLLAAATAAGTAFLKADYEVNVVAPGHQIRFKGAREIDKLRLLSALVRPGRVELPSHDNPNHIVICSVGDQRGQELASHFSRRVPVTLRTLSEIDDLTMLGLSEDLPESWTTFESKRSRSGTGRTSAEPGPGTAGAGSASAAPGGASSTPQGVRR